LRKSPQGKGQWATSDKGNLLAWRESQAKYQAWAKKVQRKCGGARRKEGSSKKSDLSLSSG
jgi:hypothetical protein